MFRTVSGSADPCQVSDPVDEKPKSDHGVAESCASTRSDHDAIEHVPGHAEEHEEGGDGKGPARPSKELKRTTSNALARVSSRLTTRSLPDPGPPPDGGWKAWTQIAAGWIAIFTTWGWINCFGRNSSSMRKPATADILDSTGVFQTYYTSTLDVSPSVISWIGTVQNFLTFVRQTNGCKGDWKSQALADPPTHYFRCWVDCPAGYSILAIFFPRSSLALPYRSSAFF
jgi:hypothetical protein